MKVRSQCKSSETNSSLRRHAGIRIPDARREFRLVPRLFPSYRTVMTAISSQRHRFAIPRHIHYLNCAYMSPLASTVRDAMNTAVAYKEQPWTIQPTDFFIHPEQFRHRAAAIMGTDAAHIAIVPSVSYGLATAARNVPLAAGQSIVVLADQFPSNLYIWRERIRETGAHLVTVQRDASAPWTNAVLAAIDTKTALVAVPNCHWADGGLVDLIAVGKACRAVGAALVLDLTQSLGALPISMTEVQPDFAVSACYKWLLGPYGIAMLYAAPRYHAGAPIEHNWINRAGSENFARLADYRDDFQPGARRFDMGEKSNAPLLRGATAAIDLLLGWGVDAIAETLAAKTLSIATQAQALGLTAAPVGVRAPHFLALGFSGPLPSGLTDALGKENVFASARGTFLRVTPHLYNDEIDAERLIAVLKRSLSR
jgi:selenocysteine lyase/cysteine desulfurase